MDTIFFTIIDAETGGRKKVWLTFNTTLRHEPVKIDFPPNVSIDSQQLGELGHLLIELAKGDFDQDSVEELIDGYDFPWKKVQEEL